MMGRVGIGWAGLMDIRNAYNNTDRGGVLVIAGLFFGFFRRGEVYVVRMF
jgi:hypothetical protein